jgi:signal transduction histidine kinase
MTVRVMRVARPAWLIVAGAGLVMSLVALAALPVSFRAQSTPEIRADLAANHLSPGVCIAVMAALIMGPTLVYFVVATIVYLRAAPDPMALVCAYVLVLFGCGVVSPVPWVVLNDSTVLLGSPLLTGVARLLTPLGLCALGLFFFVFPSGRFIPGWLRWLALAAATGLLYASVLALTPSVATASTIFQNIGFGLLIVDVGAQIYRYRRVSTPVQRQQTKWVLLGLAASVTFVVALQLLWLLVPSAVAHSQVDQLLFGGGSWQIAFAILAVGIGVAVLRFRLWDVDPIINRALLYAGLTAGVVAIYVLVVAYLGRALRTPTAPWMSLVATGMVAILLQPLRSLLQRGINRLMYGQRDEPYTVVTELGRRLETSLRGESVLRTSVETLARALKLPYAAIAVAGGSGATTAAQYGEPVPQPLILPLTYQSQPVGQLLLAPRRPGEPLTPRDLRLLHELARHIGPAVHAVALTADLQRSRERLVTAREEERRRLRRDLHDGLGPTLAGLALKASTISDLVATQPAEASRVADELYAEIRATIAEIRRLVYALRPPSLDELGLVGALREAARQHSRPGALQTTVLAEGELSALPAAVEVAAYRITREALTNVDRHAQARTCTVRLCRTNALELEIADDGVGIAPGQPSGVGLLAIRERAAELGGSLSIDAGRGAGTQLTVRIPLPPEVNADAAATRTDR